MNEDSSESLISSGMTLHLGKKYKDAERAFRRAIELDPKNPLAYICLGIALHLGKKYKDAEQAFRQAVKLDPEHLPAYIHLGCFLNTQERYEEAERAFRRVIELDPENLLAHVNLGYVLYLQKKYKDAKEIYNFVDLRQGKLKKSPYPLAYSFTGKPHDESREGALAFTTAKILYDNYHIAESIEVLRRFYHCSDNPRKLLDTIKKFSLDVYSLERILGDRHPYVIERQKELLGDKLDRAKGKLKEALEEVASIPFPERKEVIKKLLVDLEPLKGEVAPPLPAPDLSGNTYPLYVKRTDPFKHLEEVWAPWLVRYTPSLKHDYLDQKQLRERDPVLFTALSNRLKRTEEQVRDYIPPYRTPFHLE